MRCVVRPRNAWGRWNDEGVTTLTSPTPHLRASGAIAGTVAGGLVALCAVAPISVTAVIFVALGVALAWGWPRLINLPSPRGTGAVLIATVVALTAVILATDPAERTRWAGAVVCVGLIGSFIHQLLRQDGRPRLVFSVAGTALGLGILGAGSYLLAGHGSSDVRHLLWATGLSVSLGAIVDGVAGKTQRRLELGVGQAILGALIGATTAAWSGVPVWWGALAGALGGLVAWSTLRTVVTLATSAHRRAQVAAGAAMALVTGFIPFAVSALADLLS